ncbi:hypothetical protein KGY63_05730 [Candidatus Bipolaricaulota bacterium]|nr:hypothetical protein [Candidatus Bipolaricaulota bacterium]
MVKDKNKFIVLVVVLSLGLLLLSGFALADNGLSEATEKKIKGILAEKYNNLPDEKFDFADEPAATFEGIEFRPFKNLGLSEANMQDGMVPGLLSYDGKVALLIATELPEEMEAEYASGLILLSNNQPIFASKVEFKRHDQAQEEINYTFKDSGEDSDNLTLEITGIRYLLSTLVPKSL